MTLRYFNYLKWYVVLYFKGFMNLLVVSRITDNLNPTDPISTRISTHQNPTDSIFSRISYSQNPNSYDYSGNMGCQVFKGEIQNYCMLCWVVKKCQNLTLISIFKIENHLNIYHLFFTQKYEFFFDFSITFETLYFLKRCLIFYSWDFFLFTK